jgi:hypothetical protein
MSASQTPTNADLPSMEIDPPSWMAAAPNAEEAKDEQQAGRTSEEKEVKDEEEQSDPPSFATRKRKRRTVNDGDGDEKEGETKELEPQPTTAARLSELPASSSALSPWWAEDDEYRRQAGEMHICEEEAASPAPVASASASASASGSAMAAVVRSHSDDDELLVEKPVDQDMRKLVYEMRDDVVAYTERGWNWEVDQAKRKVREARKEAEHQARLDAAPKRDRPDRRPAAAAASRRLMRQAEEEEEVSSRS